MPIVAIGTLVLVSCGERVASSTSPTLTVTEILADATTIVTEPTPSTTTVLLGTETSTTMPGDALPTTQPAAPNSAPSANATLPPPVPATEHQLAVLAAAFSMPARPDLHDVPFGQEVTVGNRSLYVNVPIFGGWQYADLDAQALPGATNDASEAATRDLLTKLGIDTAGLTATFTPNGPGSDVGLAGCIVRFAEDGRIVFAYGLLEDVA